MEGVEREVEVERLREEITISSVSLFYLPLISILFFLYSPALANTINLLRRAGRLEEVPAILGAAEEKDRRSGSHAGTQYHPFRY